MDPAIDELAAIGRIIQAIKRFRQQYPDVQTPPERAKDAYLKKHLSDQDWLFWKQLQQAPPEPLAPPRVNLPEPALSCSQFKRLLSQYRRAGFEAYQMQLQSNFGETNTLPPC
ncbi:hypothetical protein [Spirosoma sp. KUDC1026]|uniref:hypothetical protein n=1 Tax=Spirosoma sp. KUDC1026 TaxID=2745947 RepID=UPI00159BD6A5|nr:hypothetical protein [Spirosoma sp. KUDC1026]QKZ13816.1 hypothetical protein HU175_14720 [Spirosoma sp. KUDC1026]